MSTKHTPAPWVNIENSWSTNTIEDMKCQAIAEVKISNKVTEETQDEFEEIKLANARLIAAAPELLEALKQLVSEIDGLIEESDGVAGLHLNGDIALWPELEGGGQYERLGGISKAYAAIIKAEGGAA